MLGSTIAGEHGSSEQPGLGRAVLRTPRDGRWAGVLKLKHRKWEAWSANTFPFLWPASVLKGAPLLSSAVRPGIRPVAAMGVSEPLLAFAYSDTMLSTSPFTIFKSHSHTSKHSQRRQPGSTNFTAFSL